MFACLIFGLLLSLSHGAPHDEDYTMCYSINGNEASCMSVQINEPASSIHYHMAESGVFEDVETLEDYNVGLAASRVESQDACYVRGLSKSFTEQVEFVQQNQHVEMTVEGQEKVSAVPVDNPEEEIGSQLTYFCGDLPVYMMVNDEQSEDEQSLAENRQISVTFTKCSLFWFKPCCFTTTLTLPTGSNISFCWIFG